MSFDTNPSNPDTACQNFIELGQVVAKLTRMDFNIYRLRHRK